MQTEYLQQARRLAFLSLGQYTANNTVVASPRFGCPPIPGTVARVRVLGLYVCCDAIPLDDDGTLLLNAIVNDGMDDDTIVASQDLETLVVAADKWYALTLAAETAEKEQTLLEGSDLRFTLVNNSAAIGTNPKVSVCVEYIMVEDYDDQKMVGKTSDYIV